MFPDGVFPAFVAHGDVGIVAAEKHLAALGDDFTAAVDSRVDGGFAAAGADGFDFRDGIGELHKAPRPGEELGLKVGPEPETEHGDIEIIDKGAELINLLRGEKLGLIGNYDVLPLQVIIFFYYINIGGNDLSMRFEADAAPDNVSPVAGVGAGLDKPDAHSHFLVVELRDERLGGFGGTHGPIFEIQLSRCPSPLPDEISRGLR